MTKDKTYTTIGLSPNLMKMAKIQAIEEDKRFNQLIAKALTEYMHNHPINTKGGHNLNANEESSN